MRIPAAWTVGRDPIEISLATLVAALGLVTLAGFLGRFAWWLDLLSHFRLHLAAAALVVAVLAMALRRFRWAALCILLLGTNVIPAAEMLASQSVAAPTGVLRVAAANMKFDNAHPAAILKQLGDRPVDVVVLSEFRPDWLPLLAPLLKVYPYRYVSRASAWKGAQRGLVLLSRWPFRRVDSVAATPDGRVLALRAVIGRLTLFGVHLLHPLSPSSPAKSAASIAALTKAVEAESGPVAVIGDFNTTPYSAAYQRLVAATGLRRAPAGVVPTFPASLGPLGLPIDHLLLGHDVDGSFRAVPAPGSDHRMLRGWLTVATPPASAPAASGQD